MNHLEYNLELLKLVSNNPKDLKFLHNHIIPMDVIIQLTSLQIQMGANIQYEEEPQDDPQIDMKFQSRPSEWGVNEG